MAVNDLSGANGPYLIKRSTLNAADTAQQVKLPSWCRKVTVMFKTSAFADDSGKVASSGTEGAAIGNDIFPIPSGSALEFKLMPSVLAVNSIYISGDSGSGYATLLIEGGD